MALDRILEIRTYKLRPGGGAQLDRIFREGALPMLLRHGIHVVGYGQSRLDPDSYFLARSYACLEAREAALAEFYGSDEWLQQFDTDVMALIESYHTVVIGTEEPFVEAVGALRD